MILGTTSDHASLHIQLTRLEKGLTPFKFYNSWIRDEEFNNVFRRAWSTPAVGTHLFKLYPKIRAVRSAGKEWESKKRFADKSSTKVAAEL